MAQTQTSTNTKTILMYIPRDIYYRYKQQADRQTMITGNKKTIHDTVLEVIVKNAPQ